MDVKEIFKCIKEKVSPICDKVIEWVQENTKQAILICSMFMLILVCILLLIAARPKKQTDDFSSDLLLGEELLIPPSPAVPNGYSTSRTTKDKWTDEEIDIWFTKPTEKELNDLSRANDKIISEITGAAP